MRILPVAMIGLALLAGCSSSSQRSAAPAPSAASGAPSTTTTTMQGDSIDRFAAAYEAAHPRK